MLESIITKAAPAPIGPYSQAIRANGFVFVSGQIAMDAESGRVLEGDITVQTQKVMENLDAILKASGTDFSRVVKTTIYLASMDDFPRMNEVYEESLGGSKPARATVEVGRLPKNVLVEIDAIAST